MIALQSVEERECDDGASQEDEGFMGMSPLLQAHHAMERMEEFVCKVRWLFLVIPCCMFQFCSVQSLSRVRLFATP